VGIVVAALTLLVVALAQASSAVAAQPCWRDVIDEWTENQRVSTAYPIKCYNQALENLPNDIEDYTDAADQIAQARQDALRGDDLARVPAGVDDDDPGDGGPIGSVLDSGTGDSSSIPLPLLILGILAGLLMAAGGAGLLARKLQARRSGPPEPPAS
jgi:hypothetical protein